MKHFVFALGCFSLLACNTTRQTTTMINSFDTEGHRGCRGLMPENTIPAMLFAIDLGVTTLEMDLHITKDEKVVLSHDPYFNENFTTTPEGNYLTKDEAQRRLLYTMTYDSIKKYDVGLKLYSLFPRQKKIAVHKPLLADLLEATEAYAAQKGRRMKYNIEIKSKAGGDGVKHPPVERFVDLAMVVIHAKGIASRTILQSFDNRALQVMHRKYPGVATSLLIEGNDGRTLEQQLDDLGFIPTVYSPHYSLVNADLLKKCHAKNMKVIPWTVNTLQEMKLLKKLGVDGLISDYPDLYQQL